MDKRPNVVFFFTDDQRFDAIGCAGNPAVRTPHMDALAKRGVFFSQACIPGGTSGAVCMPSRAMLNTGRTLFHISSAGQEISPDHTTLGEAFGSVGYHTFGSGKWHNGTAAFHRSFKSGAEIFFGGMADHWNVPVYDYDPTGKYDKRCLFVEDPGYSNKTKERCCDHIHAGQHSTDIISEAGVKFLREYNGNEPYFMYLAFLAPHDPRTMPREFLEMYNPEDITLPPNFFGGHPFDNGELHIRDEKLAGFPRTPEEIRRHLAEYYAMITHLDDRIGRVVKAVEARGELDNTLFLLCGDNGLALGQHGLMGKQSLYEHSVRVPLIFAGPGVPCEVRSPAQAYLLDIFPTLCKLCDVPVPASVDGKDLTPAMNTDGSGGRDMMYLAYTDKHRGVRTGKWKLIEYVVGGQHSMTQLFNLHNDPWEMRNLATDSAYAATLMELRRELFLLRDSWNDRESSWGKTFWDGYDSPTNPKKNPEHRRQ
jgi:arylsulfatase A-like enzyme